jgi:hypothetical protein
MEQKIFFYKNKFNILIENMTLIFHLSWNTWVQNEKIVIKSKVYFRVSWIKENFYLLKTLFDVW